MFLHSVVRFEFSTLSRSLALSSSGCTASLGFRFWSLSRCWVCLRNLFCTDKGPRRKPGTGGRTLLGKHAWRPSQSQLNASPSSAPPSASLRSSSLSSLRRALRDVAGSPLLGARRIKVMHFPTKSSTSIPCVASPRFSWVVLLAERSAVETRSRESRVASDVCLTDVNISFALLSVLINPSEPDARYSARESVYN